MAANVHLVGLKDLEQYSLAHPGGDDCALRLAYCQCLLSYDYAPVCLCLWKKNSSSYGPDSSFKILFSTIMYQIHAIINFLVVAIQLFL